VYTLCSISCGSSVVQMHVQERIQIQQGHTKERPPLGAWTAQRANAPDLSTSTPSMPASLPSSGKRVSMIENDLQ